ncbi:MAG: hypothetical protein LIV24_04035 [Eubacterium sp.]|nr:hypothetical protein [Eubacterium sp.]
MFSLIIVILMVIALFKLTGFVFHIIGKLLGGIFGILGWLILGGLAVTVFGLAFFVLPIILIIGCIAVIVAVASA